MLLTKPTAAARQRVELRHADAADGAARPRDPHRGLKSFLETNALEHRVRALSPGQLAHPLDRLSAALGDDVGGAELAGQVGALLVAAEDDDALGAEAPGGDHAADADGAVADHGGGDAGTHPRRDGGVVTGPHHVGKGQKRRHQRVVGPDRELDQGPVRLRDADRLGLPAADSVPTPDTAVDARGLQALLAELAAPVAEHERGDDEISGNDRCDIGADVGDDPDELVPHRVRRRPRGRPPSSCRATDRSRRCRRA